MADAVRIDHLIWQISQEILNMCFNTWFNVCRRVGDGSNLISSQVVPSRCPMGRRRPLTFLSSLVLTKNFSPKTSAALVAEQLRRYATKLWNIIMGNFAILFFESKEYSDSVGTYSGNFDKIESWDWLWHFLGILSISWFSFYNILFSLEVCNYVFHFSKTRHIVCDIITLSVLLIVVSQGDLSYDIDLLLLHFASEKDHVGVKWSFRQDDHFQNALVYCLHSIIIESSFQENRFQTRNLTKSNKKSVPSLRNFVVDSLSSRGSKGSMILDIIQSAAPSIYFYI